MSYQQSPYAPQNTPMQYQHQVSQEPPSPLPIIMQSNSNMSSEPQQPYNSMPQQPQQQQSYMGEKFVQQQPQGMPGMGIGMAGNRNAKNMPVDADGSREWSYGLCDCFSDCGTCECLSCFEGRGA